MPKALSPQSWSHLYVIGGETGPQKVGISSFPDARRRQLKSAGQAHLKLHHAVQVSYDSARQIEALAHWILRTAALGKERFNVTPQQAYAAIQDAVQLHAKGEGIPKPDATSSRIAVIASAELLERIENWRRKQPRIPSKSDASRQLLELALDKMEAEARRSTPDAGMTT